MCPLFLILHRPISSSTSLNAAICFIFLNEFLQIQPLVSKMNKYHKVETSYRKISNLRLSSMLYTNWSVRENVILITHVWLILQQNLDTYSLLNSYLSLPNSKYNNRLLFDRHILKIFRVTRSLYAQNSLRPI